MARWTWMVSGLLVAGLLVRGSPAPACSLCGAFMLQSRQTLRQELEQARLVCFGSVTSSRLATQGVPGSGISNFQIARVLKDDPLLANQKVLELPFYVPILDPKAPPQCVVFFNVVNGKLSATLGRAVRSPALLDYLAGSMALQGKDRQQALLYYFRFLDHEDSDIAADAFLEFARSTDQDIGAVAKHLAPGPLRKLILNPGTPPERLGVYAFLLGACGGDQDAELLKKLIDQPSERVVRALDGILGGYLTLRPRQGWDLAVAILADANKPFEVRYPVVLTLRFYHGWQPNQARPEILRAFRGMIEGGELADLAIEDLRRWQEWDLTSRILAQYGKPSHSAPITRRTILRYALSCPRTDETRQFLDTVRRQDPALVRDLEESLELERQK